VPFDDRVNQRARVDDLDRELIVDFLDEIGSELAEEARGLLLVERTCQRGGRGAPGPGATATAASASCSRSWT
jgi:ATP-dependent DNA helicase RecG